MNFSDVPVRADCKQCGVEFKPRTPNDKYCTLGCSQRHDRAASARRSAGKKRESLTKSRVSASKSKDS